MGELVNAVKNMTINDVGYDLNKATTSDAQVNLASDTDTVTHTSNGIMDQNHCFGTIREVSVLSTLTKSSIAAIELAPQTLLMPEVHEIFADVTLGNAWINRTLQRISRTGVDGSTPFSTQIHSGISKTSNLESSDSTGTKINI